MRYIACVAVLLATSASAQSTPYSFAGLTWGTELDSARRALVRRG